MGIFESMGLDPEAETPGRRIVRHISESLVKAMEIAREESTAEAAELVAGECIVFTETKDHMNWELIGEIARNGNRAATETMRKAHEEVEEEEDEHLYHTMGWTRELWMNSLGLQAVIPPPQEKRNVKTMMGAARAKGSRGGPRRPRASARSASAKKSRSRKASSRKKATSRR